MYTIGQFSKICQVTAKALRHYEAIGLIRPARVDVSNQYRLYTDEQIHTVRLIAFLKDTGMPLSQVKQMLMRRTQGDAVADLIESHRQALLSQLDAVNGYLFKLARWQEEQEAEIMHEKQVYDIRLRDVPAITVRSERKVLTDFPTSLPPMYRSVLTEIEALGAQCSGAPIALYYDEEFNPNQVDVEVAWPVSDPRAANNSLPPIKAATCLHVGPYDQLHDAYQALFAWINQNGYKVNGPLREINLNDPSVTPPDKLVTEVLFPIQ